MAERSGATVATLGERALIDRLRDRFHRHLGAPPAWVVIGIGDDAAVLEPERGALDVVTTDSLVEGVHFRREWTSARDIGYKALAVNLSDLAAMGAAPRAALLSLALPADIPLDDIDALCDGMASLAAEARVPIVGGNVTRSPGPLVIDMTLIGAARRRRILTRGGGRPGDELYVTGAIGAAACGLDLLASGADRAHLTPEAADSIERYERPAPRLRLGVRVGRNRAASACVDLSDGLADAVTQIAAASGTGAVVEAAAVPVHPGATARAADTGRDAVAWAMAGGDDYELLFAVPRRRRRQFLGAIGPRPDAPVTRIGALTAEPGVWLDRDGARTPVGQGFTHFQHDVASH